MSIKLKTTQNKSKSYKSKALDLFLSRIGKIVTSHELAQITGKKGDPISHNMRRIFELRDEDGYLLVNHKDNNTTHLNLKVDEWVLLSPNPNPKNVRSRGVNKRISFEVFSRDNYRCQFCGRDKNDDDPFKEGHKIKLHVGHIVAHKQVGNEKYLKVENINDVNDSKILNKDNFITMCNVCNEGAKNTNLKIKSLKDVVMDADETVQKEIFHQLKEKYN